MIMQEDRVSLTHRRIELIRSLTEALPTEVRVRIQGELSVINAKIKGLNTTQAARLKATADQRKIAGLAEAKANAARADARGNTAAAGNEDVRNAAEDDDPDQTNTVDAWIDAVLLRHDINFTRSRYGELSLDVLPKWAPVLEVLIQGVYAAARGQALPELPNKEPRPKPKKTIKKH